ncbi:MAG: hypothetical protein H6741_12525 [Alphaproteobacteria bacterium]|nr:hypothetical protein [Alphaproteobacteria bacterium]
MGPRALRFLGLDDTQIGWVPDDLVPLGQRRVLLWRMVPDETSVWLLEDPPRLRKDRILAWCETRAEAERLAEQRSASPEWDPRHSVLIEAR